MDLYLVWVAGVFLYFVAFLFPLLLKKNKKMLQTLMWCGVIALGLLLLKTLVPHIALELAYVFYSLIIILLVFFTIVDFLIRTSEDGRL